MTAMVERKTAESPARKAGPTPSIPNGHRLMPSPAASAPPPEGARKPGSGRRTGSAAP